MIPKTSAAILTLLSLTLLAPKSAAAETQKQILERGKYLVTLGGCNDCHTPGFSRKDGNIPEADWLIGIPVGWRGPWGTSYAANLRIVAANLDEKSWISRLRNGPFLPPMPGQTTKQIHEDDLAAIYQFIRSLGISGEAMPAALPPEVEPSTPWIDMQPKNLPPLPTK